MNDFADLLMSKQQYALACIETPRNAAAYSSQSENFAEYEAGVRQLGVDLEYDYNHYLLGYLLEQFDLEQGNLQLPESIRSLYSEQIERIGHQLRNFDKEYFSFTRDIFVKDVAILTHRLLPVGAEFVSPRSGFPRNVLLRDGVRQCISGMKCILQMGGWRPLLELHMHKLVLSDFNPRGWIDTYERMADLLELNLELRGIHSISWFLDPELKVISPNLAYIYGVSKASRAKFFYVETDKLGESGALSKSTRRRELFESGLYTPRVYMRVWTRTDMLRRSWREV